MLIPPVMPRAGTIKNKVGKNADYYEISMKQFPQQILPAAHAGDARSGATAPWRPRTRRGCCCTTPRRSPSRPSTTRRCASSGSTIWWTANGNYLPHLLPVDPTLHWANPPGGDPVGRREDTRPTFTSTPGPLHRPRADRHPRARRHRRRRRERRLHRGVVPAGTPTTSRDGLRHRGHLVRLLRRQGSRQLRRDLGSGLRDVRVSEPGPRRRRTGTTTTRWA